MRANGERHCRHSELRGVAELSAKREGRENATQRLTTWMRRQETARTVLITEPSFQRSLTMNLQPPFAHLYCRPPFSLFQLVRPSRSRPPARRARRARQLQSTANGCPPQKAIFPYTSERTGPKPPSLKENERLPRLCKPCSGPTERCAKRRHVKSGLCSD